jgi:hypothetical protein
MTAVQPVERRFFGIVDVDSGTLMVGDPGYVLPRHADGKVGVDYQRVIEADLAKTPAVQLSGLPVVLFADFGGDGTFPVFGEYEDGELMRVVIEFVEPDEA